MREECKLKSYGTKQVKFILQRFSFRLFFIDSLITLSRKEGSDILPCIPLPPCLSLNYQVLLLEENMPSSHSALTLDSWYYRFPLYTVLENSKKGSYWGFRALTDLFLWSHKSCLLVLCFLFFNKNSSSLTVRFFDFSSQLCFNGNSSQKYFHTVRSKQHLETVNLTWPSITVSGAEAELAQAHWWWWKVSWREQAKSLWQKLE